jgi:hemerythrin-like domain-containing protein
MPDTLFLLRLEHRNMGKLLGLLEGQLASAGAGHPMDADLLHLAWEYFADYPDLCHHPKEDLVYELLIRRDPDSCADLRNLASDHARLHDLTTAFGEAVRRLREDPRAAEPAAREAIRQFTQRYRQHLRDEDERFFPLAAKRLSHEDWQGLDFAVFERVDPLYDTAAEQRFLALRQRIEALAEEGEARGARVGTDTELQALAGLESFNALMKSAGAPYRLARQAAGGYCLSHRRERLLQIPECPETRAAWCAYCYLRGRGWSSIRHPARP